MEQGCLEKAGRERTVLSLKYNRLLEPINIPIPGCLSIKESKPFAVVASVVVLDSSIELDAVTVADCVVG